MTKASFCDGSGYAVATRLYQWDYGQELHIYGITCTGNIEVHFSINNQKALVEMAKREFFYDYTSQDSLFVNTAFRVFRDLVREDQQQALDFLVLISDYPDDVKYHQSRNHSHRVHML